MIKEVSVAIEAGDNYPCSCVNRVCGFDIINYGYFGIDGGEVVTNKIFRAIYVGF